MLVTKKDENNYCVIPIVRHMPRAVVIAVKSNIIEILTKEPWKQ